MRRDDRTAGAAGLLAALAVGIEALGFRVDFLTDPLGPAALPLFAAALFAAGSLLVLARPEPGPAWPDADGRARLGAATVSLVVYGVLLFPVGFLVSTAVEGVVLARLFGGTARQSVAAGVVLSGALWLLFGWLLGITLPAGAAWRLVGA